MAFRFAAFSLWELKHAETEENNTFLGWDSQKHQAFKQKMPFPQTCREGISTPVVAKTVRLASVGGWWQLWPFTWDLQWKGLQQLQRRNAWGPLFCFLHLSNLQFASDIYILWYLKKTCNIGLRHIETFKSWICVSHIDTVSYRLYTHRCTVCTSVNIWHMGSIFNFECYPSTEESSKQRFAAHGILVVFFLPPSPVVATFFCLNIVVLKRFPSDNSETRNFTKWYLWKISFPL